MQVSAWKNGKNPDGRNTYGIRVGKKNRNKHFDPDWTEVEVEIEGRFHRIPISGGFWNQCPEFRSPVIRDWLNRHHTLSWPKRHPPRFELIPLGDNQFRLVG